MDISVPIHLNYHLSVKAVSSALVELLSVHLVQLAIIVQLHLHYQSCVIKEHSVLVWLLTVCLALQGSFVQLEAPLTICQ